MITTDELDDRLHIVEQDVRQLRNEATATRREMNARFDRVAERFTALEQKIDRRFDGLGAQMERLLDLLGRILPQDGRSGEGQ